jgi:methylenetetrahydrofolate dehydrogenase (NADP+)/methenyltetrahydrofolate cyclohydrolase
VQQEATVINGKYLAEEILRVIGEKIENFYNKNSIRPKLAIIIASDDPASKIYVRNKIIAAKRVGIITELKEFDSSVSSQMLSEEISALNNNKEVSGIIVQLPLPRHINKIEIVNTIDPAKDIDGFNPLNVGRLYSGIGAGFVPPTAIGCMELIKHCQPNLQGKHVVVIGRSNIVGKPLAALLLGEDCTITVCHSKTIDLAKITSNADIVVSSAGKPKFLTVEYFNQDSIVIDVGINRLIYQDRCELVGDVDFDNVKNKVKYITPVPGGVGPMTIAFLLQNTYEAMLLQYKNMAIN